MPLALKKFLLRFLIHRRKSSPDKGFFNNSSHFSIGVLNIESIGGNQNTTYELTDFAPRVEMGASSEIRSGRGNVKNTVNYEDVRPMEELRSGKHYNVHLAEFNQRCVTIKVFHGERSHQHLEQMKQFTHRLLHPHVLQMKALSSASSPVHFMIFDGACQNAERCAASASEAGLEKATRLGISIVAGLASGLDYIFHTGFPVTSFTKEMWETYITDDNIIKISLNVCDMPTNIKFEGDDWDVFNDLCLKTFKDTRQVLYPGEAINYRAREYKNMIELKEATDIDYSDYAARRVLVWVVTERGSATLASISQHYKDYLCRSNGGVSLPNFRGSQSPRRIMHKCSSAGYARQEITLTPNIFKNIVVHHTKPHYNEKCLNCGQYLHDFPPGTRVWYWNSRGSVQYGTVVNSARMPDRTLILNIRDDNGASLQLAASSVSQV
ncbi:hypothetical protein VKT23_012458 [Stygiomarasmius scandens]|uniref:Protein kinase n=1 Tax=Marasmiellus scandens TaxID=2682957 RepID=A0ABR1J6W0_9AGAR